MDPVLKPAKKKPVVKPVIPVFPVKTESDWLPVYGQAPDPTEFVLASDGFTTQLCRVAIEAGELLCVNLRGEVLNWFFPRVWTPMPTPTLV